MLKFNDYLKEAKLSAKQKKIAKLAGDEDKIDSDDLKALRSGAKLECKEEAEQVEEGRMKDLAYDLENMKDHEFHQHYGKAKHEMDPTRFKKPVQKGHEMDRAKALAQRGMASLTKEEVTQVVELSKKTLANYINHAAHDAASGAYHGKEYTAQSLQHTMAGDWDASKEKHDMATKHFNRANKRLVNIPKATDRLKKEEVEQVNELSKDTMKSYVKGAAQDLPRLGNTLGRLQTHGKLGNVEKNISRVISNRYNGINKAANKLAKEEVEQIDELSKGTLASYVGKASRDAAATHNLAGMHKQAGSAAERMALKDVNYNMAQSLQAKANKRLGGVAKAANKLAKEEVEQIDETMTRKHFQQVADVIKAHPDQEKRNELAKHHAGIFKASNPRFDHGRFYAAAGANIKEEVEHIEEERVSVATRKYDWGTMKTIHHGASFSIPLHPEHHQPIAKLKDNQEHKFKDETGRHWTAKRQGDDVHFAAANGGPKTTVKHSALKEETSHVMSYVNATLAVMDEGKIDDLRDAQRLRAANKSAYDKDYKSDDSHPHIKLNKGTAYGGSNQKDDEGDEKPDNEKQEKRGRGRPHGSKSGARQKGGGRDSSIDGREYQLHLPNNK